MRRTFEYTAVTIPPSDAFPQGQAIYRPYLFAQIGAAGATLRCIVWPDSGADHCVFPLSFALALGLDPLKMPMQLTGGVGSVANPTYYSPLRIAIPIDHAPTLSFDTNAGFTAGMEAHGIGLLGQSGFFETFQVTFNHRGRTFSIEV